MRRKRHELIAELEESIKEVQETKKKTRKVEKLRADLQEHLAQNNFAPRLYAQMRENWK